MSTTCHLCGLPTPEPPVTAAGVDGAFCCRGCLDLHRTFDLEDADPGQLRDRLDVPAEVASDAGEVVHLSVSGMHCTSCEAFIEAMATRHEGVLDARANYPTGVVRITYDSDVVEPTALPALLDRLGYRAREAHADHGSGPDTGRLLVGGFFGMMVMVWYVLFLYPSYLGWTPVVQLGGLAGRYLLLNVWVMTTVILGYTGLPLLRGAYVSLRVGQPNMDLLVALAATAAYLYSALVVITGGTEVYFDVSVVVVLAVTVGNHYEARTLAQATGSLANLATERVDTARRRTPDGIESVAIGDLEPDDELVLRRGERVPVDGKVLEGSAAIDESLLTGEAVPVEKAPGDGVLGGTLLMAGSLVVVVTADGQSTVDRLVDLLWEVKGTRPGVQRLVDRIAAVFVPLVLLLAGLTAAGWAVTGAPPDRAVLVGLAVLVVSCPCAFGLATPLAVASGIREALSAGIVIREPAAFERAGDVELVVFDKTGTLTTGEMHLVDPPDDDRLLRAAAAVEQFASHPVADAIVRAAPSVRSSVTDVEEHPGQGASARVDGELVVVGEAGLFDDLGWSVPDDARDRATRAMDRGQVPVLVGWEGCARGLLVAADRPRPGWETAISELAATGRRIVVLTGDTEAAAAPFRSHPAIEAVYAGVRPQEKVDVVERLCARATTAMVGDGTNDAPAMAAADLGIAFGRPSELATDAADIVIVSGELGGLVDAFDLIAGVHRRIRTNLGWAFGYNAVAIPAAVTGLLTPVLAAVAMAASSLLVVANSARGFLGPRQSLADRTTGDRPAPADAHPSTTGSGSVTYSE